MSFLIYSLYHEGILLICSFYCSFMNSCQGQNNVGRELNPWLLVLEQRLFTNSTRIRLGQDGFLQIRLPFGPGEEGAPWRLL